MRRGELVVIPTDTVYGVAAHPGVPGALDRLYEAKGRPDSKAVARLIADAGLLRWDARDGAAGLRRLAARYWPGPLTLVLEEGAETIGYRVPNHAVALAVLRAVNGPLAVSSANRSGEPDARNADEAVRALGASVAVVLDAGPSPGQIPSTVVAVKESRVHVLREGAIPTPDIIRAFEGSS